MTVILGIKIDKLAKNELEENINKILNSSKVSYLVTPNPEIILEAHHDEELFYILNKADISLADGFGIKLAALLKKEKIRRISGSDLTIKLLKKSEEEARKVLIINWIKGLSKKEDISLALNKKYPKLNFLILDLEREENLKEEELEKINNFGPEIMFCGFGSPYQEKFIFHNKNKIKNLKLALGIGGSFDFISGKLKRAPLFFRFLGIEWFWRLILQPKRIRRIYKAVIIFSFKVLSAYIKHFLYRPNVACLLYKKIDSDYYFLVIEREDEVGHFQIPQGGTDGENLEKAGKREIEEELNTKNFEIKAIYKNLWKYKFGPKIIDKENIKTNYKFEYKGQRQGLVIAEFKGEDNKIKLNYWEYVSYKWVKEDEFVNSVNEKRRESAQIFLEKFRNLKNK